MASMVQIRGVSVWLNCAVAVVVVMSDPLPCGRLLAGAGVC